jgi:hypothetical protein
MQINKLQTIEPSSRENSGWYTPCLKSPCQTTLIYSLFNVPQTDIRIILQQHNKKKSKDRYFTIIVHSSEEGNHWLIKLSPGG